jgi:rod shape-determining protein MreC
MFDLLRRHRNQVLVLLLILQPAILILLGRQAEEPRVGVLGGALMRVVATAQDLTYEAVGGLSDVWNRYVRLVGVSEENERLRRELDRLEEERVRLLGVMQENARLRAMVGFQVSEPSLSLEPARVIAKDISPFFRVVRLRLDRGDAIAAPGMPVVAPSGLVGQVTTTSGDYCDVMLTVDPQSAIDVLVQRNRARGVLRGKGHDDDYSARIAYLMQRDEVQVGDVVVTSGLGGRFPRELIVGHIIEVEEAAQGLFQQVVVRPAVDFSRLEEVYIVTGHEEP